MNKMFHLFSEGENVLFRDDRDYIFFNNKFASSCHTLLISPLAETTMSTHFHSVVETPDVKAIDEFDSKIRKIFGVYYARKYGHPLNHAFRLSKVEINSNEAALNELLYVMKNPVHHYVSTLPFEYPYSSVSYIFPEHYIPPEYIRSLQSRVTTVGKLNYRRRRFVEGSDHIPEKWEVLDNDMILPSSFIDVPKVQAYCNGSAKSFLYYMNQNQTDAKKEIIRTDVLELRASGLSDIDVCKIIDTFSTQVGKKSFHKLDSSERQTIIKILKHKAVKDDQINRCLWI